MNHAAKLRDLGDAINPVVEDTHWREAFRAEPYYNDSFAYDDYAPAYSAGYNHRIRGNGQTWEEAQVSIQAAWDKDKGASRLDWNEARKAAFAAWSRVDRSLGDSDKFVVGR